MKDAQDTIELTLSAALLLIVPAHMIRGGLTVGGEPLLSCVQMV